MPAATPEAAASATTTAGKEPAASPAAEGGAIETVEDSDEEAFEPAFQAAIRERLLAVYDYDHVEVDTLAAYVVSLAASPKDKDLKSRLLRPFFTEKAQVDAFVDWLEECKRGFLATEPRDALRVPRAPLRKAARNRCDEEAPDAPRAPSAAVTETSSEANDQARKEAEAEAARRPEQTRRAVEAKKAEDERRAAETAVARWHDWVPEGSLSGFFGRHEMPLELVSGANGW